MSKWIICKNCNEKYSNDLPRCPFCGTRAPLSALNKCIVILVSSVLIIAIVEIVIGFTKKDHKDEESKSALPDVSQNSSSNESNDSDGAVQSNSELDSSKNEITDSKPESSDDKLSNHSATPESEDATTSKPQEQKPIKQIPQNTTSGVKTEDIALPTFYDATEGLEHCRDWCRPLSFIFLTSEMDGIVSDYNKQFNGDYILEVGGNIDKVMIYTYRIRFDFADVSGAKAKFEKYLDDNVEFFNSQLALYKEYSPDVTGIQVIFEHDDSNQTLTSRIFK